jgi:hypothetical protein
MAGSGSITLRTGLKDGLSILGGISGTAMLNEAVIKGYGTPTEVTSPEGTVYIKMDAFQGTTSHYRMVGGTWKPMSDD